jgi:hypothetical protein
MLDSGEWAMTNDDHLFWLAVYRAVMALAAAIKRYKLQGEDYGKDESQV